MTDEERVQLLLDAAGGVLVELHEMELEVLKTLRTEPEGNAGSRSIAEAVMFEPDESARSRRSRTEFRGDPVLTEERNYISQLLADMSRGIVS